jgi:diguanylate cyclase (GGDEF)-like protein
MLFLDLDRFKQINDQLGHGSGDALLREVANRLVKSVRLEDTVARLGGDEFVVLLDAPTDIEQAVAVADKILGILRKPYQLGTQTCTISVSIGVSLYPSNGGDTDTLLAQADAAMYRAKRRGRDQIAS